jgi:hypothetical protein
MAGDGELTQCSILKNIKPNISHLNFLTFNKNYSNISNMLLNNKTGVINSNMEAQ